MAPKPPVPLEVSGYAVLPISLPTQPSFPSPATHYLYLRDHEPKIPDLATPRSLFLANIPFDTTDYHLKHLLSTQLGLPSGRISEIRLNDAQRKQPGAAPAAAAAAPPPAGGRKNRKRKREGEHEAGGAELDAPRLPETWDRETVPGGSSAVVVFVDRASKEAALAAAKRARKRSPTIAWGAGVEDKVPALGSKRYAAHDALRYPDKATTLRDVDAYMTVYAAREAAEARARKQRRQEPDEDGFVMVTKGGRTGAARQEEARERLERQKAKRAGLDDFYRFQSREKRKERAGLLVRRFEEDREKVRKMRERRGRFKPE